MQRYNGKSLSRLFVSACLGLCACNAAMAIHIPTVPVGNAGNAPDVTGHGAVPYNYRIGTTEVTNAQYAAFLNAVAATDTHGLYSAGGIERTGTPGNYAYHVSPPTAGVGPGGSDYTYGNKPVNLVSAHDAMRFANWMHNGQPTGPQSAATTEDGAYTFSGTNSVGPRNAGARWFLPTENEWYKAAYYDPATETYSLYPTASNSLPDNNPPWLDTGNSANYYVPINFFEGTWSTGNPAYPLTDAGAYTLSVSAYGTFDQAGSVWEFSETELFDGRKIFGGAWDEDEFGLSSLSGGNFLSSPFETRIHGFRTAAVPEPSTAVLAIIGCALVWCCRKRVK